MLRILVVITYVIACFSYGSWKKWREYYPTYLYVIVGDLVYNFLFYDHALWEYNKLVSHTFSDLLVAVVVFPCAITLFLTYYPTKSKIQKQALYVLVWAGINTGIEYISHVFGFISYYNNWNIGWSMLLYCIAFILVRVHYFKPLLVWPISLVLAYITMLIFNVPLMGMK